MAENARPSLTFGVEMEMVYVHELNDFQQLTGILTGQGIKATAKQRRRYVASILRHQFPIGFGMPSILGHINIDSTEVSEYTEWIVTEDASIGAGADEISAQFNIPIGEVTHRLQWDQIELISPIFQFRNQNVWLPQLLQVQADLSSRSHLGASFCNDSCGLHVHFALESSNIQVIQDADASPVFPLLVLQHLIILWAYWERIIESFHPFWRHPNYCEYAQSLQASARSVQGLDSWPEWATHVYSLHSSDELRTFLAGRFEPKFVKIHISPARGHKKETLEFREHRGTTDASEIRCELWNVNGTEDVWRVIEMPEEGRNFLRGKIREYADLDPADYIGVYSSDGSGTGGSNNNSTTYPIPDVIQTQK